MSTVAGTPQPGNQPAAGLPQPANPSAAGLPQPANPSAAGLPQPGNPAAGSGSSRATWIALFLIFGIIVGTAAGSLAHASGVNVPAAFLVGGGAFSATVLLCLALYNFANGHKSN